MDPYGVCVTGEFDYDDPSGRGPLEGALVAGRFRVERQLARGAAGVVYKAIQLPLGRPVALKVLDVESERAEGLAFSARFAREAATLARLRHPHTVRVIDHGIWRGWTWLAMEFVEGETLHAALKRGPFAPSQAVTVLRQICCALREAHSLGIVHRDLKPANLLLTRMGDDELFAKVVDFGLVKDLGEAGERTGQGAMMGSPRYMSPEQIREEVVDPRSDVYSLGVVAWRMLTGEAPYGGSDPFAVMYAHLHDPVPELSGDTLPPCLRWVVSRCLQKGRADRFDEVLALERALAYCAEVLAGELPWDTKLRLNRGRVEVVGEPVDTRRRLGGPVMYGVGLAAAVLLGFVLGQQEAPPRTVFQPVDVVAPPAVDRGVPELLAAPPPFVPAFVAVSTESASARQRIAASADEVEQGEPDVVLPPGSPWAGSAVKLPQGTEADPWATGSR